jgi:ABC-type multidrug transport system fused ATPase/permease subunit
VLTSIPDVSPGVASGTIPPLPLAVRYLRQLWDYVGARVLVVVVATIVLSTVEGLGLTLFYPLFASTQATAGNAGLIGRVLAAAHIAMTPASVLPLIVGIFICKGVAQYAIYRYQFRLFGTITRRLRRRALDVIARADYEHVATANTGFYTNLIVGEIDRAARALMLFLRALSPALSSVVLFAMVCFLDWQLSVACVVMGLTLVALTRLTGMVVRRHSIALTQNYARLTNLVVQIVHAFKYLRATASYDRFAHRAWAVSETLVDAEQKVGNANALATAMTQPIMILFLGAMLYYRAVVAGEDLASLFVVLLYFFRVMNEINQAQLVWQQFIGLTGSVDLVRDQELATERAAELNGTEPFAALREAITLEGVDFRYGTSRQILFGIDLRIPARSTVAFVGASGGGKTTLVDLVMGTLRATSGRVCYDGCDLAAMDLSTLRAHIGYVPQDAVLFDDTIAANLGLWSDRHTRDDLRDAARRAHCLEFIEALPAGFDSVIGDRGTKLSGGQRQRIAIARELLRSPDLLVLDEATSALDSESERAIQASIDQLKGKMTIVMIAHRLSTIRGADRVYVLADGKIVEAGAFDELATRPDGQFRRMVELQEVAS